MVLKRHHEKESLKEILETERQRERERERERVRERERGWDGVAAVNASAQHSDENR